MMVTLIWLNISLDNRLLPDGTKPLPSPMLRAVSLEMIKTSSLIHVSCKNLEITNFKLESHLPGINHLIINKIMITLTIITEFCVITVDSNSLVIYRLSDLFLSLFSYEPPLVQVDFLQQGPIADMLGCPPWGEVALVATTLVGVQGELLEQGSWRDTVHIGLHGLHIASNLQAR